MRTEEMIFRFFCMLGYQQSPLEGKAEEDSLHDK